MTPITLTCSCGATLEIDTDDQKYLEKRKAEFEKEHETCPHAA